MLVKDGFDRNTNVAFIRRDASTKVLLVTWCNSNREITIFVNWTSRNELKYIVYAFKMLSAKWLLFCSGPQCVRTDF